MKWSPLIGRYAVNQHWGDVAIRGANLEDTGCIVKFYWKGISIYWVQDPTHGEFMAQIPMKFCVK